MSTEQSTDTIIIGAGPAGLAVAGRLRQLDIPFLLLEKSGKIAPSWHDHYDRLCLHTVKEHSDLPGLKMPEHYPTYVSRLDMIAYWENYARKWDISPLFGQEVRAIKRKGQTWTTETASGLFHSKNVVVATGYNRAPHLPAWPGQENFKGELLHSRQYRNAAPFKGRKVLVVGMGNTGAELALDLCENGAYPSISIRGPVNVIRRDVAGRPAQRTAILLGKLPAWAFDFIARQVQKMTVGDLSPYGLPPSPYAPSEQLRRFGKVPVIDIGTIDRIKQGDIRILPDIQSFGEHTVVFQNGHSESFDAVIACTGYRARVEDFLENAQPLLNAWGYPSRLWFDDETYRGLYFCGFTAPLSGILRNIKLDSGAIAEHIRRMRAEG